MTETYSYRDWMAMHCESDRYGCEDNKKLMKKIAELLDKNGYKNHLGQLGNETEYFIVSGKFLDVEIVPCCGAIVEVKIGRGCGDDYMEEIVRIHPAETFYAENYILCDVPTRLAHAVLNVVNKVFDKEN